MNHEPQTSLAQLAAEAATKFSDVEANAGLVREEFLTLANDAYSQALLKDDLPTSAELIGEWFTKTLNRYAKSNQASIKKTLGSIQGTLNFGTDYESVVLICGQKALEATSGRITTLALLNADDLWLMDRESDINATAALQAHERQHAGIVRAAAQLSQYTDYRSFTQRQATA